MKGFLVLIVGALLTVVLVPSANVNAHETYGEVGYSPASTWVPASGSGVQVIPSGGVYRIVDDPQYDLSGTRETVYLIGGGPEFHATSGNAPAAFVRMGTVPHEVIAVPAEYRQNWLAVAAGDRPVRCLTTPRMVQSTTTEQMSTAPAGHEFYSRENYASRSARYATATRTHRHHYRNYSTSMNHRRHRHHTTMASARYRAPARNSYAVSTPMVHAEATSGVGIMEVGGRDLYQMNGSWYTVEEGGGWARSDSWHGPFVRVKTGIVPREVRTIPVERHRYDWPLTTGTATY